MPTTIRSAKETDVPVILDLIRQLASYEQLTHLMEASKERLCGTLLRRQAAAEVLLADCDNECVGLAVVLRETVHFLGGARHLP
jgi:hypothetical protein